MSLTLHYREFHRAGREFRVYLFYCFPLTPLSGTGTPENNKQQALRAFKAKKYRVAIDSFLLSSAQRQKKSIFSLRSLRLCGEK